MFKAPPFIVLMFFANVVRVFLHVSRVRAAAIFMVLSLVSLEA